MRADEGPSQLEEDLDEIIIDAVNEGIRIVESAGATPDEIENFLNWYVPLMAAERQRVLEKVIAAIPESIFVKLYDGSGPHSGHSSR